MIKKIVDLTFDRLRRVNATVWEEVLMGTSHALEDFACYR